MFETLHTTLEHPYFSWIKKLLEAHPSAEIFLVGGAVRDAALSRPTKDYDFVVRGVQARHLQEFLGTVGIVNLVGRNFGVYKFIPDEGYEEFKASGLEAFDVALPRTEHAWGTGGYRDVEVQSDHGLPIEEDLGRRDFTINAVALRLEIRPNAPEQSSVRGRNSKLEIGLTVDPYGGMKDIEARVVRAVGDAKARFEEDYTRMLRALRFACELGFSAEGATLDALKAVMPRINDKRADAPRPILSPLAEFVAPREVVSRELTRAFYADPVRAFDLYDVSGAFEALMPELLKMKGCPQPEEYHSEGDVWTHTRLALEALGSEEYVRLFGHPLLTSPIQGEGIEQNSPPLVGGARGGVDPHYNALLIMAILFHDVGKPPMLKTPENDGVDRIRFDEHAEVGAGLAREIARRLTLSIMEEGLLHVDYDKLHWLINSHLLLLHSDPEDLKASTVEKYFFNPKHPGPELLRLAFCDGSAAIPRAYDQATATGDLVTAQPDLSNLRGMIARIERMRAAIEKKQISPKALVNGDEIMAMLKIPAGPGVGEIKDALIEEQLSARVTTKEQAAAWVQSNYG
ncbi:HD domain-containing protein [Candidatus Uhrbacteria bacterium]|nr:HD domain-containing protein [Candidatus Uhrbacteria bacterium]